MILPADVAFEVFIATSCRSRMSPDEQRLFDYHRDNSKSNVRTEKQIRLNRNNKARGKRNH